MKLLSSNSGFFHDFSSSMMRQNQPWPPQSTGPSRKAAFAGLVSHAFLSGSGQLPSALRMGMPGVLSW